jgi:hypothetical protein
MHLCRLVGAEPYLAANVGSGTPREFHDWVQYCNAPAGTVSLAAERGQTGAASSAGGRRHNRIEPAEAIGHPDRLPARVSGRSRVPNTYSTNHQCLSTPYKNVHRQRRSCILPRCHSATRSPRDPPSRAYRSRT